MEIYDGDTGSIEVHCVVIKCGNFDICVCYSLQYWYHQVVMKTLTVFKGTVPPLVKVWRSIEGYVESRMKNIRFRCR